MWKKENQINMKKLAAGVAILLMAGCYQAMADNSDITKVEPVEKIEVDLNKPVNMQIAETIHYADETKAWWSKTGLYDGKGNYNFNHDVTLDVKAEKDMAGLEFDPHFGTVFWHGDTKGKINMNGHKLVVKASGAAGVERRTPYGILQYSGDLTIENTKGIDIEVDSTHSTYGRGIWVGGIRSVTKFYKVPGYSNLHIKNGDSWDEAVKIRVIGKGEDFGAVEANAEDGRADITIDGLVDIVSKDWRAIEVHGGPANKINKGKAHIFIGGGKIVGTDVASIAAYTAGEIEINAKYEINRNTNKMEIKALSETRPVQIVGDVSSESDGIITLGLNNKDSYLQGLVTTTGIYGISRFTQKPALIPGNVYMRLANGATWIHEQVGVGYINEKGHDADVHRRVIGASPDSEVQILQASNGIIRQNAKHKLTIDDYSGDMKVIYKHDGDGSRGENYKAGDVVIKTAREGSIITMITDNSGINMQDADAVDHALNALAGKLIYEGYKNKENNLSGRVTIAEGVLDSSVTMKLGDLKEMAFNATTGQGSLKKEINQADKKEHSIIVEKTANDKEIQNVTPKKVEKEVGKYETQTMMGLRMGFTAVNTAWSIYGNDLERRMGDVRLLNKESGVWTTYESGKNDFNGTDADKQEIYYMQKYKKIQIGYDKRVGDLIIGGAAEYAVIDNTLADLGTSKITGISGAIYGTKQGENGNYVDVIAKFGTLNNKFDVKAMNLNADIKGEYRVPAYSISTEFGTRKILKDGIYVEPSIEWTLSRVEGDTKEVAVENQQKMTIKQGGMNSYVGRLALALGKETEKSQVFAKLAVAREFNGEMKTELTMNNTTKQSKINLRDTWLDFEIGGSYKMSETSYIYGTFTKNIKSKFNNKWRLDAGIRFAF